MICMTDRLTDHLTDNVCTISHGLEMSVEYSELRLLIYVIFLHPNHSL